MGWVLKVMSQAEFGCILEGIMSAPLTVCQIVRSPRLRQVNFAARPSYQLGIAGFKLILCISYRRLLWGTYKEAYRMLVWTVAAIFTLGHISGALVLVFNCTPVNRTFL